MLRRKSCLVVVTSLFLMALSSAGWASTQFGVGVTNLVTLVSSYDTSKETMDFIRLKRDATAETSFFRIKSGNYLVVTDVDFLITGGTPDQFVTLDIIIVKTGNLSKFQVAFTRSVRLDSEGNASGNVTLNAGFVIDSTSRPGAETSVPGLIQSNVQIILHGYLTS